MPEHEDDLRQLDSELQRSYWAEPTHLEAAPIVADEVNRLAQHPTMLETPHMIEYLKPNIIGEVVEETGEVLQPTQHIHLRAHNTQVVKGELEPFGHRVLAMRGGRLLEGDIIASIVYDDEGGRCELIRDEKGNVGMATITPEGKVIRSLDMKGYDAKLRAGLGDVYVTHQTQKNAQWSIEYRNDRENERGAQLSVAETVSIRSRAEIHKENRDKEKRENRLKWLKRAVGAGAIYIALMPGGLADSIADQFVGTEQTVQAAIEVYQPNSPDGQGEWERTQAAGEVVNQTLQQLDDHEYQAILDDAMEYRDAHKEEFMNPEVAIDVFANLDGAQTKEEALAALAPLGSFYGYEFIVSDEVSLDALKYAAAEVVDGLVVLPKNFTDKAVLESIYFETPGEVNEGNSSDFGGGRAAYYSPSNKAIHMSASNQVLSTFKDLTSTLPGAAGGFDQQSIFLHEFAHALSDGSGKVGVGDNEKVGGAGTAPTIIEDLVVGGILRNPQVISNYARTDGEESLAENLSGLLSDRDDGLRHPDMPGEFNSRANQTMIRGLVGLEMADPGFANYLIAQNDRLMHGQALGIE